MKKISDESSGEMKFIRISVSSWILFIILLAVASAFFVLLSYKTGRAFGLLTVVYIFLFGFVGTWFLAWIKHITYKNSYLGLIIGVLGILVAIYALSYQYRGPYTLVFIIITSIIALVHIGLYFWKFRKN